MIVGSKNISITIGNQTSLWLVNPNKTIIFQARCAKGSYGLLGEYCLDCSTDVFGTTTGGAAWCNDTTSSNSIWGGEPVAKFGWWNYQITSSDVCQTQFRNVSDQRPDCSFTSSGTYTCTGSCPGIVPCFPAESCPGNNTCATGYEYLRQQCLVSRSTQKLPSKCSLDSDCLVDNQGNPLTKVCSYDNAAACSQCIKNICTCTTYDPYSRSLGNIDEFQVLFLSFSFFPLSF